MFHYFVSSYFFRFICENRLKKRRRIFNARKTLNNQLRTKRPIFLQTAYKLQGKTRVSGRKFKMIIINVIRTLRAKANIYQFSWVQNKAFSIRIEPNLNIFEQKHKQVSFYLRQFEKKKERKKESVRNTTRFLCLYKFSFEGLQQWNYLLLFLLRVQMWHVIDDSFPTKLTINESKERFGLMLFPSEYNQIPPIFELIYLYN